MDKVIYASATLWQGIKEIIKRITMFFLTLATERNVQK
jgi:hypothetical protein